MFGKLTESIIRQEVAEEIQQELEQHLESGEMYTAYTNGLQRAIDIALRKDG